MLVEVVIHDRMSLEKNKKMILMQWVKVLSGIEGIELMMYRLTWVGVYCREGQEEAVKK
jgi:hypothetical protein